MKILTVLVIVSGVLIPNVFGLKCYKCDSTANKDCGDPFKSDSFTPEDVAVSTTVPPTTSTVPASSTTVPPKTETPGEKADPKISCYKLKKTGDKEEVVRGYIVDADKYCEAENKKEKTECTYCDKDNCNSGNSIKISFALIAVFIALFNSSIL